MLGLLNTVLTRGGSLLTYVKEGLVMANRFLTPPKLTFPVNGSAEFDGASDFIDLEDNFENIIATGKSGSVCGWVYISNTSATQVWFEHFLDASNRLVLWFNSSGSVLNFYPNNSSHTSFTITADRWYFVSANWNGSSSSWYVDGSLVSTQSYTPFNTNTTFLGKTITNIQWWNGNLANVAIWNRALSSDEINSVMWKSYEKLTTTESNGLQAWYKLQESELISGDSTATLEKYAAANSLTFEGKTCLQTALNALPTITDARLYSANYDIRVSADGGNVESLNCVETELNAIL
jgi:hypothetical protein